MRSDLLHVAIMLMAVLCGCSPEKTVPTDPGGGVIIPEAFSPHHTEAAWGSNNMIAFYDNGIVKEYPGGSFLADPDLTGLWVLDLNTTEKRRISAAGRTPQWKHDGSELAAVINGNIYVIDLDGNTRRVTAEGENFHPSWSPDRKLPLSAHSLILELSGILTKPGGIHEALSIHRGADRLDPQRG